MNIAIPRALAITVLGLALSACPAGRKPTTPEGEVPRPAPTGTAGATPEYPGATPYAVLAGESMVRILVHRGGTLASAGHNHVIVSRNLKGTFWLNEELERSGFQITLPVTLLEVDDPRIRSEEGSDFPSAVPESARAGTLRNMLSESLLDGDRYPGVTLTSLALSGTRESLVAHTRVQIKDQSREVQVPASVAYEDGRIVASGEFTIRQSDFGITPFSILLGAVTVQDELQVKFRVVAAQP